MRIGFTGTQKGMTSDQRNVVNNELRHFWTSAGENWFHHGVCIGADEEAALLARSTGYRLHGHPPVNTSKMSTISSDVLEQPKQYLDRNADIVRSCDVLIATPFTMNEVRRSGTWSTLRLANKVMKPYILIYPDGTTKRNMFL